MSTVLLDLPNEILLLIFWKLDLDSLEWLSDTNHRIFALSEPMIREYHVLHLKHLVTTRRILIRGSSLADLFQHKAPVPLSSLFILIDGGQSFSKDIRSIHTLLTQIEYIDKLQLNFRDPCPSHTETHSLESFSEAFGILVNKTRSELHTWGGEGWLHLGRPSEIISKTVSNNWSQTSVPGAPSGQNSISFQGDATLESLKLGSTVPLYAPFVTRTLSTLNCAWIKSISFSDSLILLQSDWQRILPLLTLSALTHISFGSSLIPFFSLQAFMARHEVIQVLDLAGSRVIGPMAPLSSQGLLPSLQVLIANIEYLLHFLEPSTAFPRLKSVVVVFEARYAFGNVTCNYNAFEPVLRFIAKRPGEMSLTLRLQSGMGFQTWLHGSSLEALGEVSNVVELFAYFCRPFDEGWADMQDFAPVSKLFPSLRKMKFA